MLFIFRFEGCVEDALVFVCIDNFLIFPSSLSINITIDDLEGFRCKNGLDSSISASF